MFNFSSASGLLAGQHDLKKERLPPSRPIPVTFPSLTPPEPSLSRPPSAWTEWPGPGIPSHLLRLKKPSDIGLDTLALLNVSFGPQCDFETLLSPVSDDENSYLPPKSWLETPTQHGSGTVPTTDPSVKLLVNGRRVPDRNEFYTRAKELFFNNEDAFSNLTRKPRADPTPLRLAHFRKFWEGLDNLAYYWDDSLDEYLPPKPDPTPSVQAHSDASPIILDSTAQNADALAGRQSAPVAPGRDEPRKKAKTAPADNETIISPMTSLGSGSSALPAKVLSISSSKALPARTAPPKVPWAMNMPSVSDEPVDLSKGAYRGYRIGNGADMPDQYRLDCIRAFVEPIAWAFNVTLSPHRRPPVLCSGPIRFPVRMNSVGWRQPTERTKARQGWLEGPVIGVQCRSETKFGAGDGLDPESVLDVVRELGGMLLLAQERSRQGKTENRSGEGKWWTSKPRWGGGPGGEVGEATGASDAPSQDAPPKADGISTGRPRVGSKDRRKPTPAEIWKVLRPGNPIWDPKLVYDAIGKDRRSDWDEVFMVSSLNHHISVLKLRIHRLYVDYLTTGVLPDDAPSNSEWCSPVLQRTRWYNLFDVDDRTEAMRGIWGIMAYLMRAQDTPEGSGNVTAEAL